MKRLDPWMGTIERVSIPPLVLWFKWRFEGLGHIPREGPLLVACNHISYLDPFAHGYFVVKAKRHPRFLAKSELYKNPILRTILTRAGHVPVKRGSGERAPIDSSLAALRKGEILMIYPESTVTTREDFSPMQAKTGIARLALHAKVPVVPLAVWGTQKVWQKGKRDLKRNRPIWVKAGAPLDFSVHEEDPEHPEVLRKVTDQVMAEVGLLVDDLRARYPKEWQ